MATAAASLVRTTDDTFTRFLDAAEELFAVHGYEGATIRAIARLSNANLGVLSQYWGSKKALFRNTFERRLRPIRDEEVRRLGKLRDDHQKGGALTLEDVLRAKIEPTLLAAGVPPEEAERRRLLIGRAQIDPCPDVVDLMGELFNDTGNLFFPLLRITCPHLGSAEFYWRASSVAGAFTFVAAYHERLSMFIEEDVTHVDWEDASNYVIDCLAAGMRAPSRDPGNRPGKA